MIVRFMSRSSLAIAAALIASVSATAVLGPADAQQAGLEGSWSGNGQIVFPTGEREAARCKASFRKAGGNTYGMNAVCATASTKVVQQAQLEQMTNNNYRGEFQNPEYGITGQIRIKLQGSTLSASLEGGGGRAEFNLSK
ncbi:MAG: hypothetical protein ABL898_18885 [Hyphomicrobiaceae bacterium]